MSSILNKNFVLKHEKYNDICYSLILQRKALKQIELATDDDMQEPISSAILLIDLGFNSIKYFKDLFKAFPEIWWLSLSSNHNLNVIGDLVSSFPISLSLFDITNNYNLRIPIDELNLLADKYILRFNVIFPSFHQTMKYENYGYFYSDEYSTTRKEYIKVLNNIWVLDDDYIMNDGKNLVFSNINDTSSTQWNKTAAMSSTTRQQTMLNAIQIMPSNKSKRTEFKKLEILFEDYIEQARIYNTYINNNHSTVKMKYMPSFNCNVLLDMPHSSRLDLLMVLAISIVIPIPLVYFNDVLLALLSQYMDTKNILEIPHLPLFVKTAIIVLIKRITAREMEEIKENSGKLLHKILYREIVVGFDDYAAMPTHPTYDEYSGFHHLRSIKRYLMDKKVLKRSLSSSDYYESAFSSTESTIVTSIPDIITRFNHVNVIKQKILSTSENYWIVFGATHVLSIIKRASYNRLCQSKAKKVHEDLRNILNLSTLQLHHILPVKESIRTNPLVKYDNFASNNTLLYPEFTEASNSLANNINAQRLQSESVKSPVTPTAFNFYGIEEASTIVNSMSPESKVMIDSKAIAAALILSNNASEPVVRNRIEKKFTIPTTRKTFTPSTSVASLTAQSTEFQSSQQESYKLKLKDSVNNMLALDVLTPPGTQKCQHSDTNEVEVKHESVVLDDYSITDSVSLSMYSVVDENADSIDYEVKNSDNKREDVIPSRDRIEQKYSQETLIDSHRRLLAEMGTIRNFRSKLNKDVPSRFDSMKILSPIQVNPSISSDKISTVKTDKIKTIRFTKKIEEKKDKSYDNIIKFNPQMSTSLMSTLSIDSSVPIGKYNCIGNDKIPAFFKDIKINNSTIAIHNIATTKLRLNSGFKLKPDQVKAYEIQFPNI